MLSQRFQFRGRERFREGRSGRHEVDARKQMGFLDALLHEQARGQVAHGGAEIDRRPAVDEAFQRGHGVGAGLEFQRRGDAVEGLIALAERRRGMAVQVDETGRHHLAADVDHLGAGQGRLRHRREAAVAYADMANGIQPRFRIDDPAALQHDVVALFCRRLRGRIVGSVAAACQQRRGRRQAEQPSPLVSHPVLSRLYSGRALKMSKSRSPSAFATSSDTAASPVTFTVVRAMSRIRSMPATSAMPSSGRPTEVSTMESTIRPAAGMAAVPMEASTLATRMVPYCSGVRSMPYAWAMNTAATA